MSKNRPQAVQACRRQQCSRNKPPPTQAGRRAASFFALRCAPKRDYGRIFAGTVYRKSVTDRSCIFTSVTNMPEVFVPPLNVRAVRGLRAPRNRDITIFSESQKRALAGQRKRRCPVWRNSHEAFSSEIEREHRCSIAAVEMEIEERQAQHRVEQHMAFRVLLFMQDSKCSFKSLQISKRRVGS